jgi:hypothetical protein
VFEVLISLEKNIDGINQEHLPGGKTVSSKVALSHPGISDPNT